MAGSNIKDAHSRLKREFLLGVKVFDISEQVAGDLVAGGERVELEPPIPFLRAEVTAVKETANDGGDVEENGEMERVFVASLGVFQGREGISCPGFHKGFLIAEV